MRLPEDASVNVKSTLCRGLKPINDIDDLLYQFYINFDSNCLFTTPIAELEKIWNIKLYNHNTKNPGSYSTIALEDSTIGLKDLNINYEDIKNTKFSSYIVGEGDFRVMVSTNGVDNTISSFEIRMTQAYKDKHDTFFPNNKIYPAFLPTPETKIRSYCVRPRITCEEAKNFTHFSDEEIEMIYRKLGDDLFMGKSHQGDFKKENNRDRESKPSAWNLISWASSHPYHLLLNSNKTHKILYEETSIRINDRVNF